MKYYRTEIAWQQEPPEIPFSQIAKETYADIVIIGAGHAGIQAALAAAEEGASVVVVESQNEKAYRVYGEDIGIWNSKWLIEKGFGPYHTGEIVNEYVKRSGGRVNPELIRQYVQESGPMFDHMLEIIKENGDDFESKFKYGNGEDGELIIHVQKNATQYPIELGGFKTWASAVQFVGPISHETIEGCASRSTLHRFQEYAINRAKELGVQWMFHTAGKLLLQNDTGDVTGVIVQDRIDHHYEAVFAKKAVLVATGDFGGNPDMCTALLTEASEWAAKYGKEKVRGKNGRSGYGHQMISWAGGVLESSPRGCMNLGGGPGGPWGTIPMLWLNQEGKRFCNEAAAPIAAGAVARQPRGMIAGILDTDFMKNVEAAGLEHGGPNYGRPIYYEELKEDMIGASKTENAKPLSREITVRGATVIERKSAPVYVADSLDKLLGLLGYSGNSLEKALEQIEHYNQLCDWGEDVDFGKDTKVLFPVRKSPFYGVKRENDGQQNIGLVTLAGFDTDDQMNVLRADGSKIKGLYVAGNTLGGRFGNGYTTPTAGTSIGMAMTHGRIVGKTMAGLSIENS